MRFIYPLILVTTLLLSFTAPALADELFCNSDETRWGFHDCSNDCDEGLSCVRYRLVDLDPST